MIRMIRIIRIMIIVKIARTVRITRKIRRILSHQNNYNHNTATKYFPYLTVADDRHPQGGARSLSGEDPNAWLPGGPSILQAVQLRNQEILQLLLTASADAKLRQIWGLVLSFFFLGGNSSQ